MSSNYTSSGFYDAVIIKFNLDGKIQTGKFMSLKSWIRLGHGLRLMNDGSAFFAGASRRAFDHNF